MKIEMKIFVLVSIVLCLSLEAVHALQGKAVYYPRPYKPSACFGNADKGQFVAGVSDALWNNRGACGKKYRVKCIRGTNKAPHPCKNGQSVTVEVVDFCRSPCNGVLNLSQDAFAKIADLNAGNVLVDYSPV